VTQPARRAQAASRDHAANGIAPRLATFLRRLAGCEGRVTLRAFDGSEAGPAGAPTLVLRSPLALRRLMWSPGELGLADAYVTGAIDVEGDLVAVMRLMRELTRGRGGSSARLTAADVLQAARLAIVTGAVGRRPPAPSCRASLSGRLHSRSRDRAAIAHHYDLSNDFYELLLDPALCYSCGYWSSDEPGYGLEQAQRDKLDLVCSKLGLRPGLRLLDVGCGWGSLVTHAAIRYGARATGVTLSGEQAAFAQRRLAEAGAADTAEIRLADYRDINDGPYDAVAVIEMGEHVGEAAYPAFAAGLCGLLAPGGRLLVQQMSRSPAAPGGGAFISSYIAPDMHMRPLPATLALLEGAGLEILGVQALREHYVWTFAAWRATLDQRFAEVVAMVGEEVARVWRLYLAGGGLAFEAGTTGVDQVLAARAPVSRTGALPSGWALASVHPTPSPASAAPG